MWVVYEVTEMGCYDIYSGSSTHARTMRLNGIATFILHVIQCTTFYQTKFVAATLIAKASLKSLNSRLGSNVMKYY